MKNAHYKGISLILLLVLGSIQNIQAADNGLVSPEVPQPVETCAEQPAKQQDVAQEESTLDFTIPTLSGEDEQAMHAALTQELNDIPTNPNIAQLLNKTSAEICERYTEYALHQIQQLDLILEETATNIAANNLIPTRNRGQAIQKIFAMREPLSILQNTNFVSPNEDVLFAIFKQIQEITTYAIENLKHGIDKYPEYDIANVQLYSLDTTIDAEEQLQEAFEQNNKLLQQLNSKAAIAGLHLYNIAWRWMHRNVFAPWHKNHLTEISLGGAWLTSAAFLAWYYLGGKTVPGLPARFGTWLRDKVGWPAQTPNDYIINDQNSEKAVANYMVQELEKGAQVNGFWAASGLPATKCQEILREATRQSESGSLINMDLAQQKPVGFLGRLEHRLSQFSLGKFVIGSTILLPAGELLASSIAPQLFSWLSKTVKKADNFLLGGVYRNKPVDNIIMKSNVTFDDVIGCEDAKKYGREVIEYLKNPEAWERARIAPKTGILLYGETRTGKSFWIDAFHGELLKTQADFRLISVPYSFIIEQGIDRVLEEARALAPCVIVIEEIDLLGLQRTENRERLATFMTALNSCLQSNTMDKTVIIIGTTNKLENIEAALRQPGRLGQHLYFKYPNFAERKFYIERELSKFAVMMENFDTEHLARLTEGCSYEKINTMIKGALTSSKIEHNALSQQSLERNLERFVYGISLEPCKLDDKQKRIIATHLAGEIITTNLLTDTWQIAKATIKNVTSAIKEQAVFMQYYEGSKQNALEYGKVFYCHDHDILPLDSKQEKLIQCKINRAGHIAEELILGSSSSYHPNDKHSAYEAALATISDGLDVSKLPSSAQDQFFDKAFALVSQCETEVKALLEQHKDEIVALANMLIEKEIISESDINTIIKKQSATDAPAQSLE